MEYLIGGISGMGATLITNPLDVVKIRLQLQGELQGRGKHAVHYRSVPHAFYVILRTDGITALQKGLVSALGFQLCINGSRLGLYHVAELKGLNRQKDGSISVPLTIMYSALAGTVGGIVGSPLYLIKTQIQAASHESIAVGKQHGHTGTWNACTNIYRRNGWRGFLQGMTSSIPRITIGSSVQLTMFSRVKDALKKHQICSESPVVMSAISSAVSTVFVVLVCCPFDVISTRLYNQGSDAKGKGQLYSGIWDCCVKVFKKESFIGFYKGMGPLYLRLAPHTVLLLVFWEKLNSYFDKLGLYHIAEIKGLNRNKDGGISIPRSIVCSALSGTAGGLVGSPVYLIKTQIQAASHESIAVGKQHGHKGTWNACKNIYGAYGWQGFFKGITSSIPRVTIASATQLTTFTSVKDNLKRHQICTESPVMLAILASMVSGIFTVLATCPFDVVSTRLNNQGSDSKGKGQLYSGVWDSLVKINRTEGLAGFYKGVVPLYLRLAPHTVLSLVFWDELKMYIY